MNNYRMGTKCVQAGYTPGNGEPRQVPIIQSTTFKYSTSEDMGKLFDLEAEGYFYTRLQNPTNDHVAAKIAEPLGQIDKITIIGGDGSSNGVEQVAGNVPAVMAKLFESMKEATGIDLADIVKADTYDAKVNRNVNVSGIDSVNLVVKEEKPAAPEQE